MSLRDKSAGFEDLKFCPGEQYMTQLHRQLLNAVLSVLSVWALEAAAIAQFETRGAFVAQEGPRPL